MSTAIRNYQINISDALWIDVNTRVGLDSLPDRITDATAVWHSSLYNLLNCEPGERARIFQPEYGSTYRRFLQEPISEVTAAKMQIFMLESIRRWEPRVTVMPSSSIQADTNLPGYRVRLALTVAGNPINVRFEVAT